MVTLVSCRDEVILNLNTVGPVPVIEGDISNDSVPFQIRMTTSVEYYSQKVPNVEDAFVTITGSDGLNDTLFPLHGQDAGFYRSNQVHPCKVGHAYTLRVKWQGKEFTATETCRPQEPIDSLKALYTPKRLFFPEGYYLWEWARERPGKGDCYLWNIYRNDTLLNKDFYFINDDEYVDGQYLYSDFFFLFRLNDRVRFEQMAISRQLYNFLTSVQNQVNRDGSPFSSPPSNIAGNLSNGALGYFSVRNIIRKKLVVTQ